MSLLSSNLIFHPGLHEFGSFLFLLNTSSRVVGGGWGMTNKKTFLFIRTILGPSVSYLRSAASKSLATTFQKNFGLIK